jgi:signal peptidase I
VVRRRKRSAPRHARIRKPSLVGWMGQLVLLLVAAAVLAFGVRTFLVQPFLIPSSSMEGTLIVGDTVLVNMSAYWFAEPAPGDIVVFVSPRDASTDLIKRVVAVGGDTVDIRDGVVYINGTRLVEPYVNTRYPDHYYADAPLTVPQDMVYVLGDNRANSADSRFVGPQPLSALIGKAFAVCWPGSRVRLL